MGSSGTKFAKFRLGLIVALANKRSSGHHRATSAYTPTGDILDKAGNVSS